MWDVFLQRLYEADQALWRSSPRPWGRQGYDSQIKYYTFTRKSQSQSVQGWQVKRVEYMEAGMDQVLNAEPQVCF